MNTTRFNQTRLFAVATGLLLGSALTFVTPDAAHARNTTASKDTLSKGFAAPPEASPEQIAAAERVLTGRYGCEFGKHVSVSASAQHGGYFDVKLDRQQWIMKPVVSSTGAVRLEDLKGNTMLLQILTKSMVMDRKAQRRLADSCVHDVQRAAEADLLKAPRQSLFGPAGN